MAESDLSDADRGVETPSRGVTPLVDSYGRVHRDLRISVTDRCNFRCTYCMPKEGMKWLPQDELLTYDELTRVARLLVERHGFESIRLTGGEPTVRAHLPVLIAKLAALRTSEGHPIDLALTTNGATLALIAEDLVAAGLRRINISCDSLRRDRFEAITNRDGLQGVLEGIQAALDCGLDPVKVNVVVMRGVNDDELIDLAAFGRDMGVIMRFIEFMPLDAQGHWTMDNVVTREEITETIGSVFPLEPAGGRGSSPAERFNYLDGKGQIGVIASVTSSFCDSCDRVRLTADGQFRTCLFGLDEYDLRDALRSGADDDEIDAIVCDAVSVKWAGHRINQPVFIRPSRSMSQIGG